MLTPSRPKITAPSPSLPPPALHRHVRDLHRFGSAGGWQRGLQAPHPDPPAATEQDLSLQPPRRGGHTRGRDREAMPGGAGAGVTAGSRSPPPPSSSPFPPPLFFPVPVPSHRGAKFKPRAPAERDAAQGPDRTGPGFGSPGATAGSAPGGPPAPAGLHGESVGDRCPFPKPRDPAVLEWSPPPVPPG